MNSLPYDAVANSSLIKAVRRDDSSQCATYFNKPCTSWFAVRLCDMSAVDAFLRAAV
jgi:hypothetical protein